MLIIYSIIYASLQHTAKHIRISYWHQVSTTWATRNHLRGKTVTLTYASPYLLSAVTVTLNV